MYLSLMNEEELPGDSELVKYDAAWHAHYTLTVRNHKPNTRCCISTRRTKGDKVIIVNARVEEDVIPFPQVLQF